MDQVETGQAHQRQRTKSQNLTQIANSELFEAGLSLCRVCSWSICPEEFKSTHLLHLLKRKKKTEGMSLKGVVSVFHLKESCRGIGIVAS